MEVTAVYVEQVIIGFTVLLIVALFVTGGIPAVPADLGSSAIVVGASYVVGILYDRCADTLLESVLRRIRLEFAKTKVAGPWATDPFPQLRADSSDHQYLLSRIRILRAMTTLVPPLTMAWLVRELDAPLRVALLGLLAVLYALVPSLAMAVPRTDDAKAWHFITDRRQRLVSDAPVTLFAVVCGVLLGLAFIAPDRGAAMATAVAGIGVTFLTFWAWRRVTVTHLQHLYDRGVAAPAAAVRKRPSSEAG